MITFRKYYIEQFKEVPKVWKHAKKHKKYVAFFVTLTILLNPVVIVMMYLYDTGLMKIDKRYQKHDEYSSHKWLFLAISIIIAR